MESEKWLPVAGFEGLYEVSDHGGVRSVDRVVPSRHGQTRVMRGKVLKLSTDENGYVSLILYPKHVQGQPRKYCRSLVHRLVATAFVNGWAEELEVNHIDFNRGNNSAANLEWKTPSGNVQHSVQAGRWAESHNSATNPRKWKKLSLAVAQATILAVESGTKTRYRAAKDLNVSFGAVANLLKSRDRYFPIT